MQTATVIAVRGNTQQCICPSCKHAYWTKVVAPRQECVDCDPPTTDERDNGGFGRHLDRKVSDKQYHGHYDE